MITLIAIAIGIKLWNDIKVSRVNDLNYTSSVIKRYYELSFNQWRNTLLSLGQRQLEIQGENKDSLRQVISKSAIKNYRELMAFGLTSPDGKVLTFSTGNLSDSLPNLMESKNSKRSFIKAKETRFLSIGEAYYFPNVSDWILPLRVPIRDSNGKLVAVNTTAMKYEVINEELNSFGFESKYRIHLVNNDFGTNQFYYPFDVADYKDLVHSDIRIYSDTVQHTNGKVSYYTGSNLLEKNKCVFVKTELRDLNHSLYISVDRKILWIEMQPVIWTIGGVYVILMIMIGLLFRKYLLKQKEYLASVVRSEANLKAIFESTNNIIGLFNRNKDLVEFNHAFAQYVKKTDDIDLYRGMDMSRNINSELVKLLISFLDRAYSGEKFKETVSYISPEGELYFLSSYNPIYQNGKITGLSMFVEDITELTTYQKQLESQAENLEDLVKKRTQEIQDKNEVLVKTLSDLKSAQKKLIQAEKMASLGVLSAGIGHEINNPLNFIKNGALALKGKLEANKNTDLNPLKPLFEIIDTGVNRAHAIVKSLSHFSRNVQTMNEECSINEITENCLTILQSKLKNKVQIVMKLQANCPSIKGNEGKLHQAIMNLITNAEQSIKEKGSISITTKSNNKQLVLEITDTGEGIPKRNLARIADPFFTTKQPGEGTGLGLFITYNIIEDHGGHIEAKSELEEGSTFTISFPLH
ncbi:MAG: PAS domain S-box protein [Reichenbachiella sp.]